MKRLALTVFVALLTFPFLAEAEYRCEKPIGKLVLMPTRTISVGVDTGVEPPTVSFPTEWVGSEIVSSNCFVLAETNEADFALIVDPTVSYRDSRYFLLPRQVSANVTTGLSRIHGNRTVSSGYGSYKKELKNDPSSEDYSGALKGALSSALEDLFYKNLPFLEAGIEPPQLSLSQ
ncbi:MAG: hypothetical protein AAB545_02985 [Patescibacteria group bacterium]